MSKRITIAALLATACTDQEHAERVLRGAGYSNIEMTGYRVLGCSKDDTISDGFEATDATGQRISGAVCCGLIGKACTIRVD